MAILTNINDLFTVDSTGAISFNRISPSTTTGYTFPALDGTANYILKTNGNGILAWVPDAVGMEDWIIAGDTGATTTITDGDTMTIEGGTNVTTAESGGTVTINSTDQYVGTVTSITLAADSGTGTAITTSGTFTFTGGTNITTAVSGTTVTIDADLAGTVKGSGTATRVAFWSVSSDTISSNEHLYWDNTNDRLGIGVGSAPLKKLNVQGTVRIQTNANYYSDRTYLGDTWEFASDTTDGVTFSITGGLAATAGNYFRWLTQEGAATPIERMRIDSSGRTIIQSGTFTTPAYTPAQGYPLHVQGIASQSYISIGRAGQTTGSQGMIVGIDTTSSYLWNRDNVDMQFGTNDAFNMIIKSGGNVGIGVTGPFSKLQVGTATFSGGHGMHADSRVGISNHGTLTGLMLASTYNDATHPEYGLVFVQGPNTSSYNVWSISPDGPAKGSGLCFNYQLNSTNIHPPANTKVYFEGSTGYVGIGTTSPDSKLEVTAPTTKTNLGTVSNQTITCSGGGGVGEYNQIGFGYTAGDYSPGVIGYVTTNGAVSTLGALIFALRDSTTAIAPTQRMRIDSGGSVIIGDGATSGTPAGDYRSLEIGRQGNTITGAPWKSNLYFSTNATVTAGSTAFTYRYASELPTQMIMEDGVFTWSNAVAGTVGNTISFTERMRINVAGDVGIFTTNPGARLEVKAGTSYANNTALGIKITNAGHRGSELNTFGSDASYLTHYFENYTGGSGRAYDRVLEIVCKGSPDGTYGEGIIKFKANPITSGSNVAEIMRITGSGNVGIGTTSPSYKLDVVGNIRSSTVTVYDGMGGSETGIGASSAGGNLRLYAGGTNKITVSNTAQSLILYGNSTTGSNYIQLNDSAGTSQGYVGYGSSGNNNFYFVQYKAAPFNFYLDGAVRGAISTAGTLTMGGDVIAYGSPSDKRLKENIKPIESALDKVNKLQGVTFDWKDKEKEYDQFGKPHKLQEWKNDIGFIAQDVQKIIPELVRENGDGMLSMRHQGIAPILLEAIKELKQEIEELKSKPCNCNNCNCNNCDCKE